MLNYYEFIASSIMHGDMDEKMVHLTLSLTMQAVFLRFWPMIKNDLKIQRFGNRVKDPDLAYAVVYNLVRRWDLTAKDVEDFESGKSIGIPEIDPEIRPCDSISEDRPVLSRAWDFAVRGGKAGDYPPGST